MTAYEKHQRDYTLLGTTVVFRRFHDEELERMFDYQTEDMFVLVKDGILYHFMPAHDGERRAKAWLAKHTPADLMEEKKKAFILLEEYKAFCAKRHEDACEAVRELHRYFERFLGPVLLGIYLPEQAHAAAFHEQSMEIRTRCDEVYKAGMDLEKALLRRIEREEGIEKDSLQELTVEEFERFLESGTLPDVSGRQQYVLVKVDGRCEVFERKGSEQAFGLAAGPLEELTEIKGTVAFRGKATGRVRIIRKVEEASRIEEGDILVTGMTDPRYLPAMRKAVGIVTDEGGITCHAAIVARELKVPCVIGTRNATRVLKDGDLVEVDADKGTVRRI
jgi:phosphohistidine swiveling domain-containing protein